jgi:hypothetical protein
VRALLSAVLLLAAVAGAGQQDHAPRPPSKDAAGLLKINREFYELAAITGGDFYFWDRQEFASSRLQVPVEHEEVLLSYGSVETKRMFDIPVESGVRSLTVFAGVQRKDLAVLIRPGGLVVHDGDGGASVQTFQHMMIATINAPAAGLWRLEMTGAGPFCVTAHVKPGAEGPELIAFDFVEKGGRPGHEGMFPVKRPLRAAERLACELSLSGTVKEIHASFVTKDGSPIQEFELHPIEREQYAGDCVVPRTPFRVAVTGVDANGKPFRRIDRPLRVLAQQTENPSSDPKAIPREPKL